VHYTISRDLTGSDDGVKSKLLSALVERDERRSGFSKQFLDNEGSENGSRLSILLRLGERSDKDSQVLMRLGGRESTTQNSDVEYELDIVLPRTTSANGWTMDENRYHLELSNLDPDLADDQLLRVFRCEFPGCHLVGTTRSQTMHGIDNQLEIEGYLEFKTKPQRDLACSMTIDWEALGCRYTPTLRAITPGEMRQARTLTVCGQNLESEKQKEAAMCSR
jgi:hypothetical protein